MNLPRASNVNSYATARQQPFVEQIKRREIVLALAHLVHSEAGAKRGDSPSPPL